MKFEELQEGQFIKWRANRTFKSWNTFGKILSVNQKEEAFTVMTYDDLSTTTLGKHGDALRGEITSATKDEVEMYVKIQLSKLKQEKEEMEIIFNQEKKEMEAKISSLTNITL